MTCTRSASIVIVTFTAALGLSGCRFGNHEVDPPGPGSIGGYYESQMEQQIEICATKATTGTNTQQNCGAVAANSINTNSGAYVIFNQTMTNPVDLVYDPSNGLFTLQPPNNSNPEFFFTVEADTAGDLQSPGTISYSNIIPLMPDTHPNCAFNMSYAAGGTYGEPNGPFTTGTSLPLSGRIAMQFDVQFSPNNSDCSQLEACYNSASGCDSTDNTYVQAEFAPFIEANLIQASDIPNVVLLEYQVSYQ